MGPQLKAKVRPGKAVWQIFYVGENIIEGNPEKPSPVLHLKTISDFDSVNGNIFKRQNCNRHCVVEIFDIVY